MESGFPELGVIVAVGDEARDFLHRQLSNDINALRENQACLATYNNARGRVIADVVVFRQKENLLLLSAADLCESLVERLRRYVLRRRVFFSVSADIGAAVRLPASPPPVDLPAPAPTGLPTETDETGILIHCPHGGILRLGDKKNLPAPDAEILRRWRLREIETGTARICARTSELWVAQMLNYHRTGAVHFAKGCYPGQEVIARAQYRGAVKRGLADFVADRVLAPGEKIVEATGEEVGRAVFGVEAAQEFPGCLNLCVIKHEAVRRDLFADGAPLRLRRVFFDEET